MFFLFCFLSCFGMMMITLGLDWHLSQGPGLREKNKTNTIENKLYIFLSVREQSGICTYYVYGLVYE